MLVLVAVAAAAAFAGHEAADGVPAGAGADGVVVVDVADGSAVVSSAEDARPAHLSIEPEGEAARHVVLTATTGVVDAGVADAGAHLAVRIDAPGAVGSDIAFLQLPIVPVAGDTATNQLVLPLPPGQRLDAVVRVEALSSRVVDVLAQTTLVAEVVPQG